MRDDAPDRHRGSDRDQLWKTGKREICQVALTSDITRLYNYFILFICLFMKFILNMVTIDSIVFLFVGL